jgi:hypothetical protein
MFKMPDNGIVIGPYGGIGFYERHAPTRSAERVSLWRLVRKLLSLFA